MYTLFIADDEQVIREGIKNIINWEALGFSVCGEAGNGALALSEILKAKPDLVLMDIRMPKLAGLEVIEKAQAAGFTGKFIILSGYSDFSYAKTAMKLGVSHYLTKPIDEDELEKTVCEIVALIEKEHVERSDHDFLIRKSMKEIIQAVLLGEELNSIPSHFFASPDNHYQVVIYSNYVLNEDELQYPFSDLFLATTSDKDFVHVEIDGLNVLLLKTDYALSRFDRYLKHYTSSTPQKGSPLDSLFIAYGSVVDDPHRICESYSQAQLLVSRRFFTARDQHILGYDSIPSIPSSLSYEDRYSMAIQSANQYRQNLIDYIQTFNRRMCDETLADMSAFLVSTGTTAENARLFLIDIFLQIKEEISRSFKSMDISFSSNADIISFINSRDYLYEITEYFHNEFHKMIDSIGVSSRESILDDVLHYIEHNYHNNLKLESIAPIFGYNSSYLGKIFAKSVGENFNSYVDRVRIRKAIEMLDDNLKVYEIAHEVGYSNVDYFHKKFKKITGLSPAEYRKQKN